ncbi:MAG: voltage-gated potassium channel [Solirubrobacteraceae bacterium]|jgi:hypothetical protein|nr:voltage-gated potassium channel [Solirubrobacteraceae bacterium]
MPLAEQPHRRFLVLMGVATLAFDLVAGLIALVAEHGQPHAFDNYGAALFWTTTQLLTVSSQLPNPSSTTAHVLDVVLEFWAISVVTSVAGSWAAFFHHRRHGAGSSQPPAAPSAE